MDEARITIIGAGVIGLAIAARLAGICDDVVVLEKNDSYGRETSSRNSEVIHAGIYYPPGSLKAGLCVEGARLLYEYCDKHSIAYKRLGKFIVATAEQGTGVLESLLLNGVNNSIEGLKILSGSEVSLLEPEVACASALYSANSGIFDTHSFMRRLYLEATARGVAFSFGSEVRAIEKARDGFELVVGDEGYRFRTRLLINSAGLYSDRVAAMAGVDIDDSSYALEYVKGHYFSYTGKSPVQRLVYPLPDGEHRGLGVHATPDLCGRLRFGPDSAPVGMIDYRFDESRRSMFFGSASRILPGLDESRFLPDTTGIRPRLKGEGFRDFIIKDEAGRGIPGLINLVGMESPGLTSALSVGGMVEGMVRYQI